MGSKKTKRTVENEVREYKVAIEVKYRGTDHQQGVIDAMACNLEISLIEFIEAAGAEFIDD